MDPAQVRGQTGSSFAMLALERVMEPVDISDPEGDARGDVTAIAE